MAVQTSPTATPMQQMADLGLFRHMVAFAMLGDGAILAAVIVSLVLNGPLTRPEMLIYCSTIAGFALVGLPFSMYLWAKRRTQRSLGTLRVALLLPALALLVLAFATQSTAEYYVLWLLAIVALSLTGRPAFMLTLPITTAFVVAQALVDRTFASPVNAIMTLASLVLAYLVAEAGERTVKTVQLAEGLSNRLDGAELQEQLMMNAIADAVVGVDLEKRVVVFNAAAQKLTGWDEKSAASIEYNLIFKLKDAADAELTAENDPFGKVLATKQPLVTNDFSMMGKNNTKIALSLSIAPTLGATGEISGAIGIFHDISEQQALARERNEFVSTASHEMRTPVAAIEGYVSMAMNPKLTQIDERARGFLTKAHESSVHLGQLFKDLLSVTKIEDNRIAINIRTFNITELIGQVVNEMSIIAAAKNMKVEAQVGGAGVGREKVIAPLYEVVADPERVREVMANLVDNAIKYSSQGTIIVKAETDKDFVVLSVIDQGVGISVEEQKHLFQKFYRVNNSLTRDVGGTGLGLYIARNLIERFGGRIWVESQEGKGSAFKFTLPLAKH